MTNLVVDKARTSPNFSAGRPQGQPNTIVIHHWGIDGQKFANVRDYLCRKGGNSSAHYVVEAGHVAEIVSPENRAWHAGARGNPRGIGVECRPECTSADVEEVAKLVAYLRALYGDIPLSKHSDFMATDCPGRWASKLVEIDRRARALAGAKDSQVSMPKESNNLAVDGVAGALTVKALQRFLGTSVDGVISSQASNVKEILKAFTSVEYVAPRAAQGSQVIRPLQQMLNAAGARLVVDGVAGALTVKALQAFLNARGNMLAVDGIAGALTVKALQKWLNTHT